MTSGENRRPVRISARSAARLAAVQALYQAEMTDDLPSKVAAEFVRHRLGHTIEGDTYRRGDEGLFRALAENAPLHVPELDALISDALDPQWTVPRLDTVLRAILRCAAYEFVAVPDTPARVVIDDYVTIADAFFSGGKEPGYANAVLDRIGRRVRAQEFTPSERGPQEPEAASPEDD